jgi:predicted methyltransferase
MKKLTAPTLATAMILAASAGLTTSIAAETPQPQAQPQAIDAPPPKPYSVPAKTRDYVKKAVEMPSRLPQATIHDAYRKPAELLQFANIRPGQRVVELSSYGNYWSGMLSDIVGPKGELHMYDQPFAEQMIAQGEAFAAAHPNTKFQNVDFNNIEFPRGIDLVWCYACFHEVLGTGVDIDPFFAKLSKAMKPGARILVVFYTSRDGMENRDVGALHRLDPATVRGTFQAAGFELQEEHRMLQNPADDKKTPVKTEAAADLADRTVYRFVKT